MHFAAELCDAGLLRSYPRTSLEKLDLVAKEIGVALAEGTTMDGALQVRRTREKRFRGS